MPQMSLFVVIVCRPKCNYKNVRDGQKLLIVIYFDTHVPSGRIEKMNLENGTGSNKNALS